ncbi:hypothetical protein PR202_ga17225 [Eleusine coracana subsp. coracana]|uniref:Uncharacterized protein n=1 Tax=Eleusine coracana subsp. coracana TaxID=191504 RepID=A0AAV5CPG2_ELECO|nr:hypothetical protein PR202_ga17225 [Eleusine coracana subsp. coracana]
MAAVSAAPYPQAQPPRRLGSLWSTLEDQRWVGREPAAAPLLSSAWSLPTSDFGEDGERTKEGLLRRAGSAVARWWGAASAAVAELWAFARADPRKPIFAAKVALALALISLLVFLREPRDIVSHSIWAILTVVVVFEFSIGARPSTLSVNAGATLSKGFNRGLGTLTAGAFALAVAELSKHLGELEEVILIMSTLIVAFCATLTKLHPKMKPYEYGFRVFLLTFCYVMISGFNTGKFTDTAISRFVLIAIGAAVSLGINIGCVDGYLKCMEYQRIPSKILVYQASDDPLYSGYRAAVEASAQEETLLGFAIWEPPHGPYKTMHYPWKNFTKLGGALRHCSFAVMALHGCILSEIQAPPESRRVFGAEIHRVGREGAKVLYELGNKVKTMTKLSSSDILSEVHLAADELQNKIDQKSYLLVNTERWDTSNQAQGIKEVMNGTSDMEKEKKKENKNDVMQPTIVDQSLVQQSKSFRADLLRKLDSAENFKPLLSWPARRSFHPNLPIEDEDSKTYESATALSLATFASLLIKFVARLQNVVNAFEELSDKANFKDPVEEPSAVNNNDGVFDKICKSVGLKS